MNRENRGFTLIELLVVVAIISLLTSVILASLKTAKTKAEDAKVLSEFRQIQTSLELFYNDHGRFPSPPAGTYCIGVINNCLLAGNSAPNGLLSSVTAAYTPPALTNGATTQNDQLLAATFAYKPSSSFLIGGTERGFLYVVPASPALPRVVFATHKYGVINQTVGIWKTTSSN